MKPDLCAEIRLPLADSSSFVFSSGYAIGSGMVLTCRHGLYDDCMEDKGRLLITWRSDSGCSMQPQILDRAICWENEVLDVAIVRCDCPNQPSGVTPQKILSSTKPKAKQVWESGGFLARLKDVAKERQFINPFGKIHTTYPNRPHIDLWIDRGNVEDAEFWQGFSGSSVFIGDRVAGVIIAAGQETAGKQLTAVAIADLLKASDDLGRGTLADVVGWQAGEERKRRQERQYQRMCDTIAGQREVLTALIEAITPHVGAGKPPAADAQSVVTAFNRLADDEAVDCIERAFRMLCHQRKTPQAVFIGRLAEAWLPVLFEHDGLLDGFRSELEDLGRATVDCPTKLAVPTELMMAEAEGRLAWLKLSARRGLVSHQDLGAFAESGLDEDGAEQQRQVDKLLARRFLKATDQLAFEESIHETIEAIALSQDRSGELRGIRDPKAMRERLPEILEELYGLFQRRFYYRFEADDDFDPMIIEQLKKSYPSLAFLLTHCLDERGEAKRYRRLSRIIAVAKGDTKFCEELAEHA